MASSRRSLPLISFCFLATVTMPGTAAFAAQFRLLPEALVPAAAYSGMHSGGQGYLGVGLRSVNDPAVVALHLKETRGVAVMVVDHDGPAWKAGIREHDIILNVNGTAADTEDQLRRLLRDMRPGQSVQITISRDGASQTLNAVMDNGDELGRRAWEKHWVVPAPADAAVDEPPAPPPARASHGFAHSFVSGHLLPGSGVYTGVMVNEIEPQLAEFFGLKGTKGLLVQSVESNSPAAVAGLHAGDVVTRLNGSPVVTRADWNKALRDSKGHPVSMTVMRDHHEQVLTMVPDAKHRSAVEESKPASQKSGWLASLLPHSSHI